MFGIDLGTSNSCIACKDSKTGRIEIFSDPILSSHSIQNIIAFDTNHIKVGSSCINFKKTRPNCVLTDSKQLLGKYFYEILRDLPHFPHKLSNSHASKPTYEVKFKNLDWNLYPEHLTALILSYLKYVVQLNTPDACGGCVLTVPSYFNKSQRDATLLAAKLANLNVTRLENDSIAAAVAFISEKNQTGKYLVFNYGSTTLDLSIIEVESIDKIHLITNEYEYNCGGRDIDELLLNYCIDEFKRLHKIDHNSLKERAILRENCENTKKVLSKMNAEQIYDWAYEKSIRLTREKFEEICFGIFGRIMEKVENILSNINFKRNDIDVILMIGGSSQIPYLKSKLQDFFGQEPILFHPETAIARGAALIGDFKVAKTHSLDTTTQSFGISIFNPKNDKMPLNAIIVPSGSQIPCTMQMKRKTTFDYQRRANIRVCVGESRYFNGNVFLGEFVMNNITRDLAGRVKFNITMNVQKNDMIKVVANELPCEIAANQAETLINLRGSFYTKSEEEKIEASFKYIFDFFTT